MINKSPKLLPDLIAKTHKIQQSPNTLGCGKKTRLTIVVKEYAAVLSVESCNREWLNCAKEILVENAINPYYSTCAKRKAFQKGCQKISKLL